MALYALDDLEPTIDPTAWVHPEAVVIGNVTIGPESTIWPTVVLRGDHGTITIGARTSVQDGTVVHCTPTNPTTIGDDCVIGHNAHLEGCTVGRGSLVGSGSVVLNGATIGDYALVAAGALVGPGKSVPSKARAIGVPARITEDATDGEPDWAVAHYVQRGAQYRTDLRRLG